jgi:TonB-dependent SusC/RagA subfamily outer membrane receptor
MSFTEFPPNKPRIRRPHLLSGHFLALLLLLAAWPAAAQQPGTIAGSVVEVATGAPIAGAEIFIVGTNVGTRSAEDGRFTLLDVEPGQYQLRVRSIGYRAVILEGVLVQAGQTREANFELTREVLRLDEIVVTGQAGAARRREVGNAISQIDMTEVAEPPATLEGMLGGRVAGAVLTEASGMAGSGSFIRIRGNTTVSMSNQPIVYVDGVRVYSEAYPKNVPPVGYQGRSGNVQASPLNDINPDDIERVEVIKGAAATTLYGTEASAGVIQIFTKRGARGARPRFTARITQSIDHVLPYGAEGVDLIYMDPWIRNSHGQKYSLSAQGGLEDITYFVSASYADDKAPLPNDREESFTARGNMEVAISPELRLGWNTSVTKKAISNTPVGDNAQGVVLNAWRQETNYTGPTPSINEAIDRLLEYEIKTDIDHVTTGATLSHTPSTQISQRLTVGYDRAFTEGRQFRPFGFILAPQGIMSNTRWLNETFTVDYVGSYNAPLSQTLTATLSVGGQVIETEETSTIGYSEDFPGPGEPTLSSGARTLSFEDRIRVINGGAFVQGRLALSDRLFFTAGLRVDGNSAFGQNLGLEPYPKFSASYVISDEGFWNPRWGSVKLRAAYGQAGRAPGAFDAVRTWAPVKLSGQPGFLPQNRGNPELGPERTSELEIGFSGSFLDDRLAAEFTYYNQTTNDALFEVRTVPSAGGWGNQLENVGKLRNRGIELTLDGSVIRGPDFGWDLGLTIYTNNSEVLDLGGAPAFAVGGYGFIEEGYPAPVIMSPKVTNPDAFADPVYDDEHFWGPTQPTRTYTPRTEIRFPGGVRLSARGEYLAGHYIHEANTEGKIRRGQRSWPSCIAIREQFDAGQLDQITAADRNRCIQNYIRPGSLVNRGDFFKLRDLTLMLPVWFMKAVTNPIFTVSARNAVRWFNSDWVVLEPEIGCNTGHNCLVISQQEHIPPPATYTFSLGFEF